MCPSLYFFFFFNDTATTEIYTLSLHDALPISRALSAAGSRGRRSTWTRGTTPWARRWERGICYEGSRERGVESSFSITLVPTAHRLAVCATARPSQPSPSSRNPIGKLPTSHR